MAFHEYPYTDFHEMNLDWVIKKVKELATAWAQVQQDWTDEQAAFANLQSWIENYFNNLNVQTEINVKLDAMVEAGTMSELIAPFVASGLPAVVADQIGAVVASQIGPVVAAQIGAVVADQLPAVAAAAAAAEVSAWLAAHVNPETGYVIDDSLTVQGAAADAKAVGDEFTAIKSALTELDDVVDDMGDDVSALQSSVSTLSTHKVAQPLDEYNQPTDGTQGQSLRTNGDGTTEWADVGLPTDEQTEVAISAWLAAHPEATTTVQDGSLTESKFTDALKFATIKDYVTPEMYGAKGDGTTDDTTAVQNAVTYAINNNKNVALLNIYAISSPIQINGLTTIKGFSHNAGLKALNDMTALIIYDNVSYGYDSTSITDIIFDANSFECFGIEFNGSFIMYNILDNLEFRNFKKPCIYLLNNTGYSTYGVYGHNILWRNILAMNCSTIIGQGGSRSSYIYGGIIENVNFEGAHSADGYSSFLNLNGFRNVKLSNFIIEGNPTEVKDCAIRMNLANEIDGIYFEFAADSSLPTNLLYVNNEGITAFMTIKNFYGGYYAPIRLDNINLTVEFAYVKSIATYIGAGNELDARSTYSKLTFVNAYYGGEFRPNQGDRIISRNVTIKSLKLKTQFRLLVNDDKPIIDYDLSEVSKDTSALSKYGSVGYIYEPNGYENTTNITYQNSPYGASITLIPTSADNYLHCTFRLVQASIPVITGEYFTVAITYQPTSVPTENGNEYYGKGLPSSHEAVIIGQRKKVQNSPVTMLYCFQKYAGGISDIRFDSPSSGDVADTAQGYTIRSIALFKGFVYGACSSKYISKVGID